MPRWADKAAEQLDQEMENGEISQSEYNANMRDIEAECRQGAEDAADQARDDYNNY